MRSLRQLKNLKYIQNTNGVLVGGLEILERRSERPLLELLDSLGGWPILRRDWNADRFDWILLMARLRLYNNDILIAEWVGPDIKNSGQYVIQVRVFLFYSLRSYRASFLESI